TARSQRWQAWPRSEISRWWSCRTGRGTTSPATSGSAAMTWPARPRPGRRAPFPEQRLARGLRVARPPVRAVPATPRGAYGAASALARAPPRRLGRGRRRARSRPGSARRKQRLPAEPLLHRRAAAPRRRPAAPLRGGGLAPPTLARTVGRTVHDRRAGASLGRGRRRAGRAGAAARAGDRAARTTGAAAARRLAPAPRSRRRARPSREARLLRTRRAR